MSAWIVYSKDGLAKCEARKLEYSGEFMGACSVSINVSAPTPIKFKLGDWLEYRGERFELNYDPSVVKESSSNTYGEGFIYDNVVFNSLSDELTRCDFLDVVPADNGMHYSSLPTFSFFAESVSVLAERIQENLNRVYTGGKAWTVNVHPEYVNTKKANISASNLTCWDALALVKSQFDANFIIKGRTITIGTSGIAVGNLFTYGKGNGLYSIEKNAESNQKIITRLRAYGSTRNMPSNYYQTTDRPNMAVKNLMLPSFPSNLDPYIDSHNKDKLGIREGTVFFDGSNGLEEIYPTMEGMTAEDLAEAGIHVNATGALDEVFGAEQITDNGKFEPEEGEDEAKIPDFTITLKDIGFDLNDYLSTSTATISMKDGMCGGREFEIVKCEKSGNNYVLTCHRNYDEGLDFYFPYKDYQIKSGDKFVLLNIEMPDVYIQAASQRLLAAAQSYLAKNDYVRYSYTPKVDDIFLARQHDEAIANGLVSIHDTIKEGDFVLFEDNDLEISGSITIDLLSIKEDADESLIPRYEITLKEEKTVGTIEKIQNQISSILGGTGGSGGGVTSEQIKSILETIGGKMFLSKQKDDRTPFNLGVGKNLTVGESVVSEEFTQGELGNGYILKYDKIRGHSYFEVDEALIRKVAYFVELIIKKLSHVGGSFILSPASMRCDKVEEYEEYYRCYFLAEHEGKSINQEFRVNDQARSQTFNVKPGVNHNVSSQYYWRLVVGISDEPTAVDGQKYHYIDLSKIDCDEASLAPLVGDDIVQLGNRTDPTRQNAIILSTVGEDAPSIKQYEGIQFYTLAGKEKTVISPKGNVLVGDFLSKTGEDILKYIDALGTRLDEVQTQTDRSYTIWFFEYEPTLENIPASEWTDESLKRLHLQDMFYNEDSGRAYRFEMPSEGVFVWNEITDRETIKALEKAAKAQGTADSKIRNFVSQPVPPYEVGDRWSNATFGKEYKNDDLVCIKSKGEGESFDIADWQLANGVGTKKFESEIKRLDEEIVLRVTEKQANDIVNEAGVQIKSDVAKIYAKSADVEAALTVRDKAIELKVSADNVINSINVSKENITINADKINLVGKVTFKMLAKDTTDAINGKATPGDIDSKITAYDETIIEGGYIKTSLINADAIVAKQLQATDAYKNILTANSTGLFITGKEGTERIRLRGDASSAYLRIKSTAGHISELGASGLSFSYGDYSTIITYSGITLGDDCNIKGFKLGNTSPTSVKKDTDFIRTGSSIVLPAPSSCWGKVIFTRTTAECTISSTGKNIYPRSGALTESFTRNNTAQFFISDGTYWYEFYCG